MCWYLAGMWMLSGFWYATAKPQKEARFAILQYPSTEHMAAS